MNRTVLITGATQGLGLALVGAYARRLDADDTVYLTGRSPERIVDAAARITGARAQILTERYDVAEPDSAERLAATVQERHGGADIVINNAVMRIAPDQPAADVIDEYVAVNNLGTTRTLRAFAPILRDGGRLIVVASSLGTLPWLAPVLHDHFDELPDLDAVDRSTLIWRDAVKDGSAFSGAWPAFINIPSKIAQVAAVRTLARQRKTADLAAGTLLAAYCPGMINTPTSGAFWDVSDASTPEQAAAPLISLTLEDTRLESHYGELIRGDSVVPWKT